METETRQSAVSHNSEMETEEAQKFISQLVSQSVSQSGGRSSGGREEGRGIGRFDEARLRHRRESPPLCRSLRVWLVQSLIPEGNRALLPCRGYFPHFLDAPEERANQRPDRDLPFPAAAGSVLPSSELGVARSGRGLQCRCVVGTGGIHREIQNDDDGKRCDAENCRDFSGNQTLPFPNEPGNLSPATGSRHELNEQPPWMEGEDMGYL
ncbi:hypothetical protein QR685DRAFT_62012 [Neurospora intermedia]|uniref:Uncharacterized protein n=1 Tax=Neurospora intermedia TaxID=5142 RepID=A0ABR3DT72_NEUIN